jgi:D-amino-acid dehydrogenase
LSRILIIGAGISGVCAAWYLRQDGHEVTVCDYGTPDDRPCSWGNAGMVTPSHFIPLASPGTVRLALRLLRDREGPFALGLRPDPELLSFLWQFYRASTEAHVKRTAPLLLELGRESCRLFDDLAGRVDFGMQRRGIMMLCKTEHEAKAEAELAKMAVAMGMPAEVMSPADVAAREPALRAEVAGGVYFPDDRHLDPRRLLSGMREIAEGAGVRFLWEVDVIRWRRSGRKVEAAITHEGDLTADEYVVASGKWSAAGLRKLGIRAPIQPGKGYSITLADPPKLPAIGAILVEARVAVTPMGSELRFAGTMDLGCADLSIDDRRVRGMIEYVGRYYPELRPEHFRDAPVWAGFRPCSPDGLPYVGRSARYDNLSVNAGHAMQGVSLGPVSGKLLADAIAGRIPGFDTRPLSPDRYS